MRTGQTRPVEEEEKMKDCIGGDGGDGCVGFVVVSGVRLMMMGRHVREVHLVGIE